MFALSFYSFPSTTIVETAGLCGHRGFAPGKFAWRLDTAIFARGGRTQFAPTEFMPNQKQECHPERRREERAAVELLRKGRQSRMEQKREARAPTRDLETSLAGFFSLGYVYSYRKK